MVNQNTKLPNLPNFPFCPFSPFSAPFAPYPKSHRLLTFTNYSLLITNYKIPFLRDNHLGSRPVSLGGS